ncbi:LysR substrate-binding domain-containing protein [Gordonia sp. (in: high G+C Gram-positive bacteria)]|uniref:LysR substrate-binding domain-containing protein n=1 Tax=Gordonia sp. (in: high G+C Gram-positive bacteria) TaxID=84139 RepID=UPI003527E205
MNTRRLRAFVAVAEELHFTRAAARLYLAQQSLSKQIAELEADVGTPLLTRTSRRVELTPAGTVFLDAARDVLARLDQGVTQARSVGRGEHAVLRVGFIVGAALELTPLILGDFAEWYPDARLELREFGLTDPTAGLGTAETDVAFLRLPCATDGLDVYPLFTEPSVVGVRSTHRLAARESLTPADLADEPIAVGRTSDAVWRDFWTLARADGPLVETSSHSEEMEVVAAGLACCITPAAAARFTPRPAVRFVPLTGYPGSTVAVAHRAGADGTLVRGFVETATATVARERETVAVIGNVAGTQTQSR